MILHYQLGTRDSWWTVRWSFPCSWRCSCGWWRPVFAPNWGRFPSLDHSSYWASPSWLRIYRCRWAFLPCRHSNRLPHLR